MLVIDGWWPLPRMVAVSESLMFDVEGAADVWRLVGGAGGNAADVAYAYLCTR